MSEVIGISYLENMKVLIAGLLIYVIIFALMKKTQVLGDDNKVNSIVALLAAIIVSFSGVVTYAISYAINWFVILIFMLFLGLLAMMFLEIKISDLITNKSLAGKIFLGIFFLLFAVIILKGLFALNNYFDTENPPEDPYEVDPSFNLGVDDMQNDKSDSFIDWLFGGIEIEQDLIYAVIFLLVLGLFVFILGR